MRQSLPCSKNKAIKLMCTDADHLFFDIEFTDITADNR